MLHHPPCHSCQMLVQMRARGWPSPGRGKMPGSMLCSRQCSTALTCWGTWRAFLYPPLQARSPSLVAMSKLFCQLELLIVLQAGCMRCCL